MGRQYGLGQAKEESWQWGEKGIVGEEGGRLSGWERKR